MTSDDQALPVRRPRRGVWLAAAAATLIVTAGILWLAGGGDEPEEAPAPTVITLTGGEGTSGRCLPVTADLLGNQGLAFDGTVTTLEEPRATMKIGTWYAGDETDLVVVDAPPERLSALIGAVRFEVGGRYLVAATDGQVAPCGMSAAYSPALAALYDEAFGR